MGRRNADFICAVVIVGLLAGFAGLATTLLLRSVEHLSYHYTFGPLLQGVTASSPIRRAAGPMVGGGLAGLGWWILRSRTDIRPLSDAIAKHERIRLLPFSLDAALQVLAVGSGASLGREGAPRQLRIMLKSWRPRAVGAALITSSLAVAVSSFATHNRPSLYWPNPEASYRLVAYALVLAPVALLVGLGFNSLLAAAHRRALQRSWLIIPAIAASALLIGFCSNWWPELPGNGRSILTVTLAGGMTLTTAAAVLALKPLLTALFVRAGAMGGMLTPALATGAATGALFVLIVNTIAGTQFHLPALSLAGAAGVLAVTQRTPFWAAIFVWELSRPPLWLISVYLTAALGSYGLGLLVERGGVLMRP